MQTYDSFDAWQDELDEEPAFAEPEAPPVSPFLLIGMRLESLRRCLADLQARPEHADDPHYQSRCEHALASRARIAADEMNQALEDWWPGCASIARPH